MKTESLVCMALVAGWCTNLGAFGSPQSYEGGSCIDTPQGVLAFSSVRDGNSDIYTIELDASDLRRITSASTRELEPNWSPDGLRLAYQSQRPHWAIYIADDDGAHEQRVTMGLSWSPAWSPDGEWIAYSTGPMIERISPSGENRMIVTQDGNSGRPAWSHDGQRIAFHSTRSGNSEIYLMDIEEGQPDQLTEHPGRDFQVTWEPDGQHLAFSSDRDGDLEIFTIRADSSELAQLTDNGFEDILPAWSPDGVWIAFVSGRDGNREIYLMRTDGRCSRRVTDNPGDDMYPAWKPPGPAREPGSTQAP